MLRKAVTIRYSSTSSTDAEAKKRRCRKSLKDHRERTTSGCIHCVLFYAGHAAKLWQLTSNQRSISSVQDVKNERTWTVGKGTERSVDECSGSTPVGTFRYVSPVRRWTTLCSRNPSKAWRVRQALSLHRHRPDQAANQVTSIQHGVFLTRSSKHLAVK